MIFLVNCIKNVKKLKKKNYKKLCYISFLFLYYKNKKMPRMSRKYCLSTSPSKMGFSQKSSCKAQGLLKRTSKKNKGKYVVSPKYKSNIKKRSKSIKKSINKSLYSNGKNKPRIKTGYGTEEIAKQTLKNLKGHPKVYQMQIVNTMYNRAKHHKYQTDGMKKAMKVYKKWISSQKSK